MFRYATGSRRVDNAAAAFKATSVVQLPAEDADPQRGIARVWNRRIDRRAEAGDRFYRRQPVRITHLATGRWVVRHAYGATRDVGRNAVALSYDTLQLLDILGTHDEVTLDVRPARHWEVFVSRWFHEDPLIANGVQANVIGVSLGVLGVLLALVSFF